MINRVLAYYTDRLENYLENIFHQPEGIVKLAYINEADKGDVLNRLVVSLVSIEKETAAGTGSGTVKNVPGGFYKGYPSLKVNLNVIFAAVYDVKRYPDALSVLSATLLFIQANPFFNMEGKQKYTVEIISLSAEELNNIWSCMGGHYHPSVVCRIKGFVFDAGEVKGSFGEAGRPQTETGKKS